MTKKNNEDYQVLVPCKEEFLVLVLLLPTCALFLPHCVLRVLLLTELRCCLYDCQLRVCRRNSSNLVRTLQAVLESNNVLSHVF